MVSWQCPKCKGRMYSSWDNRDKAMLECIHCKYKFENVYHLKEEAHNSEA